MRFDDKTLPYFRKQTSFATAHFRFTDCGYYFCHKAGTEDPSSLNCFYCYCPFYPCKNRIGNGKWIRNKDGKKIWDCSDCVTVHRKGFVGETMEWIYQGKNIRQIKRILQKRKRRGLL